MRLVLLPGLDGTAILFRPFIAALPGWIEPRCVEYPSAGPNDYRTLLAPVRAACSGPGDFAVLGWSFSGALALMLAAESPPGLRAVVLCGSFLRAPWPGLRWLRRAATAPVARLYPLVTRLRGWADPQRSGELVREELAALRRMSPAAMASRTRAILELDARAAAARCPVPVLYVAGSRDWIVPRWNARAVAGAVPASTVVTIPGPHLALRTSPAEGAEAVARFLAACRQAPR